MLVWPAHQNVIRLFTKMTQELEYITVIVLHVQGPGLISSIPNRNRDSAFASASANNLINLLLEESLSLLVGDVLDGGML